MKTLGQVACEAFNAGPVDDPWGSYPLIEANWQYAAQAVRAAVIEECAKVCDKGIGPYPLASENTDHYRAVEDGMRHAANMLRSLK